MKSALIGIIASLSLAQAANACPTYQSSVPVKTATLFLPSGSSQTSISVTLHPRAANTWVNLSQIESAMGVIDGRATAVTTVSGIAGGANYILRK